jgi:hypothetical protein
MKAWGGGIAPRFLTPDGGECSTSCSVRFISGETTPGIDWIGGWVVSQGVWMLCKRKISFTCQESNPDSSVVQPAA